MNVIAINEDHWISVKSSRITAKKIKIVSMLNVVSNHSNGSCVGKV